MTSDIRTGPEEKIVCDLAFSRLQELCGYWANKTEGVFLEVYWEWAKTVGGDIVQTLFHSGAFILRGMGL